MAKWKGAYVIGTTSSKNIDFLEDLGADETIDYKKEKFEDKVKDVDVVIDLIGGDTQKRSLQVLKNGGRLITTVAPEFKDLAKEKNIHLENFMAQSDPEDLEQIAALIDEGKIKPFVEKIMPLKDAAKAHELLENGSVQGKIVLEVI